MKCPGRLGTLCVARWVNIGSISGQRPTPPEFVVSIENDGTTQQAIHSRAAVAAVCFMRCAYGSAVIRSSEWPRSFEISTRRGATCRPARRCRTRGGLARHAAVVERVGSSLGSRKCPPRVARRISNPSTRGTDVIGDTSHSTPRGSLIRADLLADFVSDGDPRATRSERTRTPTPPGGARSARCQRVLPPRSALRARLRAFLADGNALLEGNAPEARPVLDLVLTGRVCFTRVADNDGGHYLLRVPITFGRLMTVAISDVGVYKTESRPQRDAARRVTGLLAA